MVGLDKFKDLKRKGRIRFFLQIKVQEYKVIFTEILLLPICAGGSRI